MQLLRLCWRFIIGHHTGTFLIFAGLVAFQRATMLVLALKWGSSDVVLAAIVAGVAVVLERVFRVYVRVQARSTAISTLAGNALAARTDPMREAGALAVVEGLHDVIRFASEFLVPAAVDLIVTLVAAILLARTSLLFVALAVAGLVVTVLARRLLRGASDRVFSRYMTAMDELTDCLEGRNEIVAAGEGERFARRIRDAVERWRVSDLRAHYVRAVATRVPLIATACVILFVVQIDKSPSVQSLLLLGAAAPSVTNLFLAVQEVLYVGPNLRPLEPFTRRYARDARRPLAGSVDHLAWRDVVVAAGELRILDGISFEARRGEIVALAGPNGSGKTTALLMTLQLAELDSGEFLVDGERSFDANSWRAHVTYLAQRPYLSSRRDIAHALAFPSMHAPKRTNKMLSRVGWSKSLDAKVDHLSGGERQRIALARVLLTERDVYLLDEPDANLDAAGITMVAGILRELADAGKIVVVAAHTPGVIAGADRVVHLENGRVTSIEERSGTPSVRRKVAES